LGEKKGGGRSKSATDIVRKQFALYQNTCLLYVSCVIQTNKQEYLYQEFVESQQSAPYGAVQRGGGEKKSKVDFLYAPPGMHHVEHRIRGGGTEARKGSRQAKKLNVKFSISAC
jgi:hypothetical protein